MKELSLHILDLAENSITANALLIELDITENTAENFVSIKLKDNGKGMSKDVLTKVTDPYYTTRTTRNVGLGIPMFKMNTELTNGEFSIESTPGVGTTIFGKFTYNHIDRPPLGNIASTVTGIVMSLENSDLCYTHTYNQESFSLDTREMRQMLGENVNLSEVFVLNWVQSYIKDNLDVLYQQ